MADTKFELKALNVVIGGKLYRKEDGHTFDTVKMASVKDEILAAVKGGYLVPVKADEPKKPNK